MGRLERAAGISVSVLARHGTSVQLDLENQFRAAMRDPGLIKCRRKRVHVLVLGTASKLSFGSGLPVEASRQDDVRKVLIQKRLPPGPVVCDASGGKVSGVRQASGPVVHVLAKAAECCPGTPGGAVLRQGVARAEDARTPLEERPPGGVCHAVWSTGDRHVRWPLQHHGLPQAPARERTCSQAPTEARSRRPPVRVAG